MVRSRLREGYLRGRLMYKFGKDLDLGDSPYLFLKRFVDDGEQLCSLHYFWWMCDADFMHATLT